jgi:hypothetical protein
LFVKCRDDSDNDRFINHKLIINHQYRYDGYDGYDEYDEYDEYHGYHGYHGYQHHTS